MFLALIHKNFKNIRSLDDNGSLICRQKTNTQEMHA